MKNDKQKKLLNRYIKQTDYLGRPLDLKGKIIKTPTGTRAAKSIEAYIPADQFVFRKSKGKYNATLADKIWRLKIKEDLEDFGSLEFQKNIWINNDQKYFWPWHEACSMYFDDLRLNEKPDRKNEGLDYHVRKGRLTVEEAEILRPFNEALGKYSDKIGNYPTAEEYKKILSDPEWIRITEMAKDILKKIDFDTLPEDQK